MHRTTQLLLPALLLSALAACSGDRAETPAATTSPPGTSAPAPEAPPSDPNVTMRYTCDGDHTVAVHGDSSVTVTTADGTTELQRVADSAPPQFADDTLSFSINQKGAELGHAGVGAFACQPE